MMEKYKICPSCRNKNYPGLLECLFCEADLTGVRITDDETEKATEATAGCDRVYLVRICDCGAKNPPNARKCAICNEDIGDVTPCADPDSGEKRERSPDETPSSDTFSAKSSDEEAKNVENGNESDSESAKSGLPPAEEDPRTPVEENEDAQESGESPSDKQSATNGCYLKDRHDDPSAKNETVLNPEVLEEIGPVFTLTSLDGRYSFRLPKGETVVGRASSMADHLAAKPFVSRVHCRFILSQGILTLENLSTTNYTFCNNNRVVGCITLKEGDEIALGGFVADGKRQDKAAYFLLRVTACK